MKSTTRKRKGGNLAARRSENDARELPRADPPHVHGVNRHQLVAQRHLAACFRGPAPGGIACLSIRKHDHFTPTREMRRYVRALTARNHPEGRYCPMKRHALVHGVDRHQLVPQRHLAACFRGPAPAFARTSIYDKYSRSMKITTHLDYISRCKTTSGTNRWT